MVSALVKENVLRAEPLALRWLALGACACGALLLLGAAPRGLPPLPAAPPAPAGFGAARAAAHLANLTALGPRVAGSYESEVAAVQALLAALRDIQRRASPHNQLELDRQVADGAFAIDFFDGMSSVYRGVQSVAARLRGKGGAKGRRSALLLNCHFDTVPDSPGASDDGAGCAVLLETLRALAATPWPLRHDAVFLFNGAEENIMQASHAFITQHRWAATVRAFVNLEACGAGGREVLFQAGPHDPWLLDVYADKVPHPFASSLAQEMFESGLVPADTDFRVFRDFGRLSGVDLAWNGDGYVYHTRLDTAERVSLQVLQRTGDNVLALAHGLLASEHMESEMDRSARQPVYFDVLGVAVVAVRAPLAALMALGAVALVLLAVQADARAAQRELLVTAGAWWRGVLRAAAASALAGAAGLLASVGVALALHALGARLAWYARPWLLGPLFGVPALCVAGLAARALEGRSAWAARGWWRARALADAGGLLAALVLVLCTARGLRSGFLPLLWTLPALALALVRRRALWPLWALAALAPAAQTSYMWGDVLATLVPMLGRSGTPPLPPDALVALVVAAGALLTSSWLLPLVAAARRPQRLMWPALALCSVLLALVALGPLYAPYSEQRPQRLMVFQTRRTLHAPLTLDAPYSEKVEHVEDFYWVPELDANTPRTLERYLGAGWQSGAAQCARWPYCGAPYFLPVRALVPLSRQRRAPEAPRVRLRVAAPARRLNASAVELVLHLTGGASHTVLVVAPASGVRLVGGGALPERPPSARWGGRRAHFVSLFAAAPRAWSLPLLLVRDGDGAEGGGRWAQLALAAHAMSGAEMRGAAHLRLLRRLPRWVAATGWGVDLHLLRL